MFRRLALFAASVRDAHRRWGAAGWIDFAIAWIAMPVFTIRLRFSGPQVMRFLPERKPSRQQKVHALRLAAVVHSAARHAVGGSTCLTRSMVLRWLLERQRIPCELVIGATRLPGGLDAHAWVECDGVPINDSQRIADRFPRLDPATPGAAHRT